MKILLKTSIPVLALVLGLNIAISEASGQGIYIKASAGYEDYASQKSKNEDKALYPREVYKDANGAKLTIAAGYRFNDIFRGEFEIASSVARESESIFESASGVGKVQFKKKPQITTAMLGGYADIVDIGPAKLFVGGKLGIATVEEQVTKQAFALQKLAYKVEKKGKKVNNLSYAAIIGASVPMTRSIDIDIDTTYQDYGETKSQKFFDNSSEESGKTKLRSFGLNLGIKYYF